MASAMSASSPILNDFEASRKLTDSYGFVPNLFRVQDCLLQAVAVEAQLIAAVVLTEGKLKRQQKEGLLHAVAGSRQSDYCLALYTQTPPGDDREGLALFNFTRKLACYGPWISAKDVEVLAVAGFDDQVILEVVATTALGQMLCILADCPSTISGPGASSIHFRQIRKVGQTRRLGSQPVGPYLKSQPPPPSDFEPFSDLRDQLGFIPGLFRAQMLRPDLVTAEVRFSRADPAFGRPAQPRPKGKNTVSGFSVELEHVWRRTAKADTGWSRCRRRRVRRDRK